MVGYTAKVPAMLLARRRRFEVAPLFGQFPPITPIPATIPVRLAKALLRLAAGWFALAERVHPQTAKPLRVCQGKSPRQA